MSDEQTAPGSDDDTSKDTTTGPDGAEDAGQPGISDDQLPPDVRPSDDNPLAYGPTDDDEDEGMSLGGDDAPGAGGDPGAPA